MKKFIRRIVNYFFGEYLDELKEIHRHNRAILVALVRIRNQIQVESLPKPGGLSPMQPLGPIDGVKTFGDHL